MALVPTFIHKPAATGCVRTGTLAKGQSLDAAGASDVGPVGAGTGVGVWGLGAGCFLAAASVGGAAAAGRAVGIGVFAGGGEDERVVDAV